MTLSVVLVAAGTGQRLGRGRPKALVELLGRPLVAWAIDALAAAELPPPVLVHPPGQTQAFRSAIADRTVRELVPGGATRSDSVRAGLTAGPSDTDVVVVHDAARPLVPPAVVRAAVDAVRGDVLAAAPALAVADTLKHVVDGEVRATVDRSGLVGVQTPQVFRRAALTRALGHAPGPEAASDELVLVERLVAEGTLHGRIVVTPGSPFAMKVTYPDDLAVLAALARRWIAGDAGRAAMVAGTHEVEP